MKKHLEMHYRILALIVFAINVGAAAKYQGPSFLHEPPNKVMFYNNTGAIIPCAATGNPRPTITWSTSENTTVTAISGLRNIRRDGSLVFPPFEAEDYRQDVHAAVYRCVISNTVGTIMSRDVHVRGVLFQSFDIRVYDEYVIRGNIGVLRCSVPSYVRDYVVVISWKRDDGIVIEEGKLSENDKYVMFPTGELHVRNVDYSDSHSLYKCEVLNLLTRQKRESLTGGTLIVTEPRGNIPPRLSQGPRRLRVDQGQDVLLPCAAQGHPLPKYRWTHVTSSLSVSGARSEERMRQLGGVLLLRHAVPQDTGTYTCVAMNEVGEVRTDIHLTVRATIRVSMWPASQEVSTGYSVTINCTVKGYPINSVEWKKNRKSLDTASRRIVLIGQTVLHISAVQRDDRGMYQCFARNDEDSAQASSQLTIASDPPRLVSKFEELVVNPGDTVSLRCSTVGNPLPQITWFSYGTPVQDTARIRVGDYVSSDGNVISFVNITRIEVIDGGEYKCKASNEYGEDSFSATVHVRGPPTIRAMENKTAVAGQTLIIHCPISGYPIHTVRWKKGKKQLPLGRRQKVFTNGTLLIQGLDGREDQGSYRCQAESREGDKASSDVYIKVLDPPSITPFFFPKSTHEGKRASVSCSVESGDPPIHISWLKDGQPITQESISVEAFDDFISALVFKSLKQDHSGVYTCVAYNDAAKVNYSATLSVNAPAKWRIEPSDQYAPVGGMVMFDCIADGRPEPRVIWKKAKGELGGDYKTVISGSHIQTLVNGSLVIRDVEEADAGRYMCEASNGVGSSLSTVVTLTVHVPAYFKQKFASQTVRQGESVKLRCEAFGEKPISYMWLKDRQPFSALGHPRYVLREQMLESGHLSELTIHVLERQDNGLYTCVASNAYGQDEKNNQLIVQERPDPPTNLEAIHTSGRNIAIRWSKAYNGNSPITKFILEYTQDENGWEGRVKQVVVNGDRQQVNVEDLSPMTQYSFRVIAENAVGRSLPSILLNIVTEGEVPGGPPRSVRVVATDSRTIQVTWEPPARSLQHGTIRGYYIGYRLAGSSDTFVYTTVDVRDNRDLRCDITDLQHSTEYSIVVQAFNEKGAGPLSDEVKVRTLEFDPPKAPVLKVTSTTSSTINLSWELENENGVPVSGYVMYWREHGLEWSEEQLPPEKRSHKFTGLRCGTKYQFYIAAFNSMGKGQPSDVVSGKTEGTAPIAPSEHMFISRNSTTFLLRLSAWRNGGCPIAFFVIQYKEQKDLDWKLLSTRIEANEESTTISELNPGTWYNILVSAHNGVGVTEVEYVTSTLTVTGATVGPHVAGDQNYMRKFKSLAVVVPIASAALVLVAVSLAVFFLICKKRSSALSNHYEGVRINEDAKGDTLAMSELEKTYDQCRESVYFPAPYATSRVPATPKGDGRMEREGCRSLHHEGNRASEHIYDLPQQIRINMRRQSYHLGNQGEEALSGNHYDSSKAQHMGNIRDDGLTCDIDAFLMHEKLSVSSQWSPSRRWHPTDVLIGDGEQYSPIHHVHPQTILIEAPELSDAECDRDLRLQVADHGQSILNILAANTTSTCLAK